MKTPAFVLIVALLASAKVAIGQDDTAINEAYQRAAQGLSEFKSGHYAEALENYSRAFAIMRLPALAVHMARANVKLGRYRAAIELYEQALTLKDGVGDPEIQARARSEAQLEQANLRPRIPKLLIRISGAMDSVVSVSVDGIQLQKGAYASGLLLDPGTHQIIASHARERLEQWVALTDGQARELSFTFVERALGTYLPRYVVPDGKGATTSPSAWRNAAWLSFGVGGTGLLVWGTAGLVALHKSNELKSLNCGGRQAPCPSDETANYSHWKTLATVSFYTGAAALLVGTVLYLAEPNQKKSRDSAVSVLPWLALGKAGVEGRF